MEVLVTGGAGFIGRNIISACKRKGWKTTSFDLLNSQNADESVNGSILNLRLLEKTTRNVDLIFHQAAVTSPPQFERKNTRAFTVNTIGTLNLLHAAVDAGVKRVVLASSSAVYGDIRVAGVENMPKPTYRNLYPLSKAINEETGKFFSSREELEVVSLRYFNTYGNGENIKGSYSSIIHKFLTDAKSRKRSIIYGNGEQKRDFIFVKDVARANILASEKGRPGEIYNVGTGVTTTFIKIYDMIKEIMQSQLVPLFKPVPFKNYQTFTQANTTKAKMELGFISEYDLRKGIRTMLSEPVEMNI